MVDDTNRESSFVVRLDCSIRYLFNKKCSLIRLQLLGLDLVQGTQCHDSRDSSGKPTISKNYRVALPFTKYLKHISNFQDKFKTEM